MSETKTSADLLEEMHALGRLNAVRVVHHVWNVAFLADPAHFFKPEERNRNPW